MSVRRHDECWRSPTWQMLAFSTFQQAHSYLLMNRAGEGVMSSYVVSTRVILAVTSNATRSLYPLLVGGSAFALTLSMLMPFVPVLITPVLARRERWRAIAIAGELAEFQFDPDQVGAAVWA